MDIRKIIKEEIDSFGWINDEFNILINKLVNKLEGSPFEVKLVDNGSIKDIAEISSMETGSVMLDFTRDDVISGKVSFDTIVHELSNIIDTLGYNTTKGKIYQNLHDYLVD
jgi:hypothetical protein